MHPMEEAVEANNLMDNTNIKSEPNPEPNPEPEHEPDPESEPKQTKKTIVTVHRMSTMSTAETKSLSCEEIFPIKEN